MGRERILVTLEMGLTADRMWSEGMLNNIKALYIYLI